MYATQVLATIVTATLLLFGTAAAATEQGEVDLVVQAFQMEGATAVEVVEIALDPALEVDMSSEEQIMLFLSIQKYYPVEGVEAALIRSRELGEERIGRLKQEIATLEEQALKEARQTAKEMLENTRE